MNVFDKVKAEILAAVDALIAKGDLPAAVRDANFVVEPPRDATHGDAATNIAMTATKRAGLPPRKIAEVLAPQLTQQPTIESAEIAGPGFINLRLSPSVWQNEIRDILASNTHYGDADFGRGVKVNVEYVSANPTGPMHVGHVRGACVGDALCNLMAKVGYDVTKEYYFNDAGAQVDTLARTVHLRYREALGENIGDIPEGLYPGDYLVPVAEELVARDGKKWQDKPESEWLIPIREFAVEKIITLIREDLALIGIKHDVFSNERDYVENGTLEASFKKLEEMGLIYVGTLPPPKGKEMTDWEPTPLTLFRSSQFGDQTDRPLKKRDGTWAYIMPDIAYHYDKIRRGFKIMINVLGADHGGYLERMRPAVAALGGSEARLDVIFNQMVKVFKNGEPVKLSKRSGNLITLREMVEEVGPGAVRFFMLTRSPDSHLEFDFAKVVEQSRDNPVFYVQYAHARCCSVLRHGAPIMAGKNLATRSLEKLTNAEDVQLIKSMASFPRVVKSAAEAREPHRIAHYLYELAGHFHAHWNKGKEEAVLRYIHENDNELTLDRLALISAVKTVLASGMAVMGVTPLEEM